MTKTYSILLSFLLLGCSISDPLEIPNFNAENFKSDRGGCKSLRVPEIENLKAAKELILGTSENALFKAIGRYDYQVLSKRNEKIYVYFLEPGPQCEYIQNSTDALSLVLYMNATKLVKEMEIQRGGHSPH